MRHIPLTRGLYAIVDDDDYEWLDQWKWYAHQSRYHLYARRCFKQNEGGNTKGIFMHRQILGSPENLQVDHVNGNGLDNQRVNLRVATNGENQRNQQKKDPNASSRFKGVSYYKRDGVWIAQIGSIYLGRFASEKDAATAYNEAAIEMYGGFALLNTLEGDRDEDQQSVLEGF